MGHTVSSARKRHAERQHNCKDSPHCLTSPTRANNMSMKPSLTWCSSAGDQWSEQPISPRTTDLSPIPINPCHAEKFATFWRNNLLNSHHFDDVLFEPFVSLVKTVALFLHCFPPFFLFLVLFHRGGGLFSNILTHTRQFPAQVKDVSRFKALPTPYKRMVRYLPLRSLSFTLHTFFCVCCRLKNKRKTDVTYFGYSISSPFQ